MRKIWWVIIGLVLLLVVSCGICMISRPAPIPPPLPPSPPAITPPPPAPPPPAPTYKEPSVVIKTWRGTGTKNTEPFTVNTSPWLIRWTNNPTSDFSGRIAIWIHGDGGVDLIANTSGAGTDFSYVYRTGTFYLGIEGVNTNWTVEVLTQ